MYTLSMAKNDYQEGWIDGFSLLRIFTNENRKEEKLGWIIELWKESPEGIKRQLSAARGNVRIFKTLDAAVDVLESIGWDVDYLTR